MEAAVAEQRIRAHVRETPLWRSRRMSASSRADVFLKLENLQETGSFKLRGAANKLLSLPGAQAARGIVAASNGNHALAVATIGRELGIPVEVFVSEHVDPLRRSKIESMQALVQTVGGNSLLAEQTARRAAEKSGRTYVSPYNDRDVVTGQATNAAEILRQLARTGTNGPDAVFVAVGGGGLIGGIGLHLKSVSPVTEIVGADRRILPCCMSACAPVAAFLKSADDYAGKAVVIVICGGNADPALEASNKDM
jgi:threonine dehydratase